MTFSNFISRLFGGVASARLPSFLQRFINAWYVRYFKIDLSEFGPLEHYESLNALFTRKLTRQRALESGFISPSDGKILECGASSELGDEQVALSIKGFTYSIDELLGGALKQDMASFEYGKKSQDEINLKSVANNEKVNNLKNSGASFENQGASDESGTQSSKKREKICFEYVNIYLSPRDYHRYHCPVNMRVKAAFYISGALKSVSEKSLEKVANLYARNERFVLECETLDRILNDNLEKSEQKNASKRFFMVFVGALNVGKMCFNFDKKLQKKAYLGANFSKFYDKIELKKGDELGHFELGSTIVLLFKKNDFKLCVKPYESVKFGQQIAEILK